MKNRLSDVILQGALSQRAKHCLPRHDLKVVLGLFLLVALVVASATLFSNQTPNSINTVEWTGWAFLHPVEANEIRRQDAQVVVAQETAGFSIQNPELVNQERRKDPAVVEAERLAAYAILNAKELQAERRKDPELVRKEQEAWNTLVSGGK